MRSTVFASSPWRSFSLSDIRCGARSRVESYSWYNLSVLLLTTINLIQLKRGAHEKVNIPVFICIWSEIGECNKTWLWSARANAPNSGSDSIHFVPVQALTSYYQLLVMFDSIGGYLIAQ